MAGKNITNYYKWLDLPVETFVSDPQTLSEAAEKKIREWQNHKKTSIQQKAQIHGDKIRQAIKDPEEWKKIYLEYANAVYNDISEDMELFVNSDKREIKGEDVKNIAAKYRVSEDYVKNICADASHGFTIVSGSSTEKTVIAATPLEDLAPPNFRGWKAKQDLIESMGEQNLIDFLANLDFLGVSVNENMPNAKILEALEKLKQKWKDVPSTGPKATQKSQIDKIYAGFTASLKDSPFGEYIRFLKYMNAKATLDRIASSGVKELGENVFNEKITQLFEYTENREKAKGVLIAFCQEKGIAFPVDRPKLAICPFCSRSFERSEPIQQVCPVCGKKLAVQCPKCGKMRHIITEPECDGINIGKYPLLENKLAEIEKHCDMLNLETAKDKLNSLLSEWRDFPGADKVKARLDKLDADHGANLKKIAAHCDNKELYSAISVIERINGSFPGFKDGYGSVYAAVSSAEEAFETAMKEPDQIKRLNLLVTINDSVTDFTKLNTELQKTPVEPVASLEVKTDSETGTVYLSWSSANMPNSVIYEVRRKVNAEVSGIADGEFVGKTQSLSYGDTGVAEGTVYYYAVFAARGSLKSPLLPSHKPALILKRPTVGIKPSDGCLDLSWPSNIGRAELKIFFSDSKLTDYDQGTPVKNISDTGVLIEGLTNGTPYYVTAYKTLTVQGKTEFRSALALFPAVTPIKPLESPRVVKSLGDKAGEYILKDEVREQRDIVFYYTESRVGISENAVISTEEMESKAKKLPAEMLPDGSYRVDMGDKQIMFVYPAVNAFGSLTVGNIVQLVYVKHADISASISGSTLCLSIGEWPSDMDRIIVCYNFDTFPMDSKDCDKACRVIVDKRTFTKRPVLEISNLKAERYYISLFACSGTDETLMGNKEVNLRQCENVAYEVRKTLFGGFSLVINNNNSYRPAITFALGSGVVPLSKEKAALTFDIPANTAAPAVETISVPIKGRAPKNCHCRIFCDDAGYKFFIKGKTQLS
ncbi:MAG: hypothetical protein K2J80_06985 [Oscillospiraceae bacterium]|nr:hypothetical protein [Oscillospiraceae bacterium]